MEIIVRTFNLSDREGFREDVYKYHPELDAFEPMIPDELRGFSRSIREIIYLTSNKNKLAELRSGLSLGANTILTSPTEKIELTEIQDSNILNIVQDKCLRALDRLEYCNEKEGCEQGAVQDDEPGTVILVEDSCLSFDALNGMPGPYVKWFLEAVGPEGLFRMLTGFESRSAEAICIYALMKLNHRQRRHRFDDSSSYPRPDQILFFRGVVPGQIVRPRQKSAGMGWGWDPIFEECNSRLTFAEMGPEVKLAISHRALALKVLMTFLKI